MKIKKLITVLFLLCIIFSLFAGCTGKGNNGIDEINSAENTETDVIINVGVLKGPTGMGSAYMWDESVNGNGNYKFGLETDASVMSSKLMNGEYDIAALPSNAASALYNKSNGKIKIIAVNTLGVLHLVAKKDSNITSVDDLKGKTVVTSGKGAVPEYVINYLAEKNGLNIGSDVNIEYLTEHSQVVASCLQDKADIVILPEPFVTQLLNNDTDYVEVADLTEEWNKVSDGKLAMGVFAVNKDFADNNPGLVEKFIYDYNESQKKVNSDVDNSSLIIEKYDILSSEIAVSAIPNSNIVCIYGDEMKNVLNSFFSVLYESNPQSIGGKMPDDGIWFKVKI